LLIENWRRCPFGFRVEEWVLRTRGLNRYQDLRLGEKEWLSSPPETVAVGGEREATTTSHMFSSSPCGCGSANALAPWSDLCSFHSELNTIALKSSRTSPRTFVYSHAKGSPNRLDLLHPTESPDHSDQRPWKSGSVKGTYLRMKRKNACTASC
jgi:hypothetical protein